MKNVAATVLLLVPAISLSGCVFPRLGMESVRYDNINRPPTPKEEFVAIYDSRDDVPFPFVVIGEVQAAPMAAERDFGHNPIELLKDQARALGGIALLEVRSGDEHDSRHVWKGKVIVRKKD